MMFAARRASGRAQVKQIFYTLEQLPIQLRSLTANSLLDPSADLLDSTLIW